MSYWQFRLRLYNESLKLWLESIKQLSLGITALFPLALPALIFLPFLAWGILAEPATEQSRYLNTLWAYLLFVYAWMYLQHQGILATHHQDYVNSLPVTRSKRRWVELALIVYSANILLLGPLYLLLVMFYQQAPRLLSLPLDFVLEQLMPILGLLALVSYYCVSAVRVATLPWLSLFVLPMLAMPWAAELAKGQWLVLWCVGILIERQIPLPQRKLGLWPTGFFRLQLQADLHSPRSESLRFVALLLLTIMLKIMFAEVKPEAQSFIAGFLSFCTALLMASSLFDAHALLRLYQPYFASLPLTALKRQMQCVLYVALKSLPGMAILFYMDMFDVLQWALWLLFYLSSLVGIVYRPRWFFIFPIVSAIVVFLLVP